MTTHNNNNNNNHNNHHRNDPAKKNNNNRDDEDDHCDPFVLIEKGYEYQQQESLWESAHYFLQASTVLHSQAHRGLCPLPPQSHHQQQQQQRQQQQESQQQRQLVHGPTTNDNHHDEEDCYKTRKIAALYEDQANFYLLQARKTLLDAMQRELHHDEKLSQSIPSRVQVVKYLAGEEEASSLQLDDVSMMHMMDERLLLLVFEPKMNSLTRDEIQKRRNLFCRLFASSFSKEEEDDDDEEDDLQDDIVVVATKNDDGILRGAPNTGGSSSASRSTAIGDHNLANTNTNTTDKALSLEERLALLNSSLKMQEGPTKTCNTISDEQRWKDLHKSLSGLGVTIPTNMTATNYNNGDHFYAGQQTLQSEEDAVDEIINMAKDEVSLMKKENDTKECGSRDVLLDLIQNSSIRLNLDDSSAQEDDSESQGAIKTSTQEEEMNFWKNLNIENDNVDTEAMSKMDQMKRYLETAQQLLLQVSVCMEELTNEGYCMEEKQEKTMEQEDSKHPQKDVESEQQDLKNALKNQDEMDQEETNVDTSRKHHAPHIVIQDNMEGKQTTKDSDNGTITNLVQMGTTSLEEALETIEKVRSMWNSSRFVPQE